MAQLSRVPPPKSAFDGRWGGLAAVMTATLIVAILKPWGSSEASPRASERPRPSASAVVRLPPRIETRRYDPAALGEAPPEPAWEVWGAGRTLVQVPFSGPPEAPTTGDPSIDPAATPLLGGPVIDLGSADGLAVLGLNSPPGNAVAAVRLWRFGDGGHPQRIELAELPSPWPVDHFRVFALRRPGMDRQTVVAWEPGLYRLDLLVDPADRIRSLMLTVQPGSRTADGSETGPEPMPRPSLTPRLLGRLPPQANLWTYGSLLTGWARPSANGTCRVAELWRAVDDRDRCRPLPIGESSAIGVNLPAASSIDSIRLVAIDPLPGALDLESPAPLQGRDGLAMIEVPPEGLPDGIYRLDVRLVGGGVLHWYVELSPGSRRAAQLTSGG